MFLATAAAHGAGDKWGLFASHLRQRVGCASPQLHAAVPNAASWHHRDISAVRVAPAPARGLPQFRTCKWQCQFGAFLHYRDPVMSRARSWMRCEACRMP